MENDSFTYTESVEDLIVEDENCDGVLQLEGLVFPVESAIFDENMELFKSAYHHYQDIPAFVFVLLLIVGVFGNVANVFVYSRPFMRNTTNCFLCIVEFVNIFVFATFLPDLVRYYFPDVSLTLGQVVVDLTLPVVETAVVCCSNWLTVAIGLWRYVSYHWPLYAEKWCNWTRTKLTIAAVLLISVTISIPGAFLHSFEHVDFNVTYLPETQNNFSVLRRIYKTRPSQYMCRNPGLDNVTNGLILLTTSLPCCCLAIVTILLLTSLWSQRRERGKTRTSALSTNNSVASEIRTTVMLTLLAFLFFLAYLPDAALNVRVLVKENDAHVDSVFYKVVRTRILILICNCLTFFIYFFLSERYREAFSRSFKTCGRDEIVKDGAESITFSEREPSIYDIPLAQMPVRKDALV